MKVSDWIICKAGGLIITEALACGIPLMLIDAIPGQETGNADYVVRNGAGHLVLSGMEVLEATAHLLMDNGRLLHQLHELNAKLAELQQVSAYPESTPQLGDQDRELTKWRTFPWGHPLPWEVEPAPQADLERLLGLYKENLLTDREFQILKQRILI